MRQVTLSRRTKGRCRSLLLSAVAASVLLVTRESAAQACAKLPQPQPSAPRVTVSTSTQLQNAVASAGANTTIFIAPGTYDVALNVTKPGLTLRSATDNRADVVLDGAYATGEIIAVRADDVTIAHLTIKRAHFHLLHVAGGSKRTRIHDVLFEDSRQQFVKINAESGQTADAGSVTCSQFRMTAAGRTHLQQNPTPGFDCYTGGIDAHQAQGWTVTDNRFEDIYCTNGGLAEHCVHFWNGCKDMVVERNVVINCARGIGFGLGNQGTSGGRIVNNTIYADIPGSPGMDVGIGLESAAAGGEPVLVEHNTIYSVRGSFNSAIDTRFSATNARLRNNLFHPRKTNRDGATVVQSGDVAAEAAMFVSPATGDLHLDAAAASVTAKVKDKGVPSAATNDIDGETRDALPDVGADELVAEDPDVAAPKNLRITDSGNEPE